MLQTQSKRQSSQGKVSRQSYKKGERAGLSPPTGLYAAQQKNFRPLEEQPSNRNVEDDKYTNGKYTNGKKRTNPDEGYELDLRLRGSPDAKHRGVPDARYRGGPNAKRSEQSPGAKVVSSYIKALSLKYPCLC